MFSVQSLRLMAKNGLWRLELAPVIEPNDVTPDEARKTDEEAGQKKIPTPLEVLRESLEKAVKDIREEIVEKRIEPV